MGTGVEAATRAVAPLVFISHARDDDSPVRQQLRENLAALEKAGKIRVWIDLEFKPGVSWRPELKDAIAEASVAILLVSRLFLSASFIRDVELPALEFEHQRRSLPIMPLLLEECMWTAVPLIADAVIWPNEKRRLNDIEPVELQRVLVEFVKLVNEKAMNAVQPRIRADDAVNGTQRLNSPLRPQPIGREHEKDECVAMLQANRGLALYGLPGQGKTELARYVASCCAQQYPDGFCEVDLQNEHQVENLPRLIATALGTPEVTSSYDLLRHKRMVFLLDGFDRLLQDSNPVPIGRALDLLLSALGENSRVIITSQQRIDKAGVVAKKVRPLLAHASLELFQSLSDAGHGQTEVAALQEFVDKDLAGHPLSIKIVARYCSAVRVPIEVLRRLWREKWTEIAKVTPSLDDRTLLASFELSYATLSGTEPQWLLVMSLLPDGISTSQIREIWPDHETEVYDCVRTLSNRAFLEERSDSEALRLVGPLFRFAFEKRSQAYTHPLKALSQKLDEYSDAIDRFIDRYVQAHAPQPTDVDPRKKNELIRAQFHNVHASLERRLDPSKNSSTLSAAGSVLLLYWAYHNNLSAVDNPMASPVDAIRYLKRAHDVYVANERTEDAIRCQYYIGNILWLRGDIAAARPYLGEAISNDSATPQIVCDSQRAFAHIEYKEGSLLRSVELYEKVIERARLSAYSDCVRRCLVGLLDAYRKLEHFDRGISLFESAVRPEIQTYQRSIRGNALRAFAYILSSKGDLSLAEEQYNHALAEFSGVSAFGQAHCKRGLGDVYTRLGRLEDATNEFDAAIRLYDEAQKNPSLGVGLVLLGRGRISLARNDTSVAIAEFRHAADLFDRTQLNEPYEFAVAHELLGDAHIMFGNVDAAGANYQIAIATFVAMNADRVVERLRAKIR